MSVLREPLVRFRDMYHGNESLMSEQEGWDCSIILQPEDIDERIGLRFVDGRVVEIHDSTAGDSADLVVRAESQIILDILELKLDPSEPYMFGELTVEGEERHFTRLDYLVTVMCPG